ncbi:LysR substrate-binding domain-containing protein [Archangium lansingense]|uniref:LysR substrate-binding domain-containing protein n=1 Tax=Archangium lansingense TaxID=2995310 RepID=A0ABT4AFZ9_9BACT|nr:LysR substrate-binding domain-containing protein [Archangium lansinium]MCY1080609.1 LysR substrate-binding domain-containing protein [Archangium lansinium]
MASPPARLTARPLPVSGPPRPLCTSPPPQHGLYPAYTPPRELSGHRCINYRHVRSGGLYAWDFEAKGRPFEVRVEGPLVFNNTDLIREAALAGHGLAYIYEDEVAADIEAGRLTRILEKWSPTFPGYYLYHPSRRQTPPALAALIGALRYKP